MNTLKNFINDKTGMETLEYAFIAGLIAAAAIIVFQSFGPTLSTKLNSATESSSSPAAGNPGGGNPGNGGGNGGGNGNPGGGNGGGNGKPGGKK